MKSSVHWKETYKEGIQAIRYTGENVSVVDGPKIIDGDEYLEYASRAWAPWLQIDKYIPQRIDHRDTELIIGSHGTSYEEGIKRVN